MPLWGKACTEVALAVGVARQTVYTWKRLRHEGGIDALRAVPDPGRPAQLDQAQLAALPAAILQSPTEYGVGTELWTLKRVGAVIERMHGMCFRQTQVWRHVSVIAGLTRTNCLFRLHEGSFKKESPVEYLWAWLKRHALANFCPSNLSGLHATARNKLKSAQK